MDSIVEWPPILLLHVIVSAISRRVADLLGRVNVSTHNLLDKQKYAMCISVGEGGFGEEG
jgi:hypothetical protein